MATPTPSLPATMLRWVGRAFTPVICFSTLGLLARGGFGDLVLSGVEVGTLLGLLGASGRAALSRVRQKAGRPPKLREELELGCALVATAFVLVALGGPSFFPLVYLLVAFLVSVSSRTAGLTLLGVALVFDGVFTLPVSPWAFGAHGAFLVLFATLYHLVLAARLWAARRAEHVAVADRLREVEERARTFRLVNSGSNDSFPDLKDEERWLVASVKEIEGTLGNALEIAEAALAAQTCAAFLLSADDRWLKLHDCRSESDLVRRDRFGAGEGALAGVIKRAAPLRLNSAGGLRGVTYYEAGAPAPRALLAVPIVESQGLVRGVLVADRAADRPFTEAEERLLGTIAGEVWRAVEVERVMGYIRKARDEKERFFKAIEEMNRATAPDQVFQAVLDGARQVADVDFCAVTLVSERDGKRVHRIARVSGVSDARLIEGVTFPDNNGLVSNVVRYGAPLPGRDVRAMDRQVIFDDAMEVRGLSGLKIFPLVAGDRILGTLVAGLRKRRTDEGTRRRAGLDDDGLRMLEVIASQAAQAVLRAQLYGQMEQLATTDGLTGLVNHRTFQQRADEVLAQSKRYGRKCSLILTDIDHFKSVNDTYGHPIGDQVLKGVARIIREMARDTDIVARYGGEEFAIVMPETDARGAHAIAERIREAVLKEVFQTELGPLKVTLSLGIATVPEHAAQKQEWIDLADQCLYHAKRGGRNRSVTVDQLRAGRRAASGA